jgi:ribonuclease BN (tRNA processing enzyme)
VLLTDACDIDAEDPTKAGWGHSSVSQVADLAPRATVKRLCIFHHDPSQNDDEIDRKLEAVQHALLRVGLATQALAPSEHDELSL